MSKEVILTGLRVNGEYHLGNYIGAILPMVQMAATKSSEYQINLFIPDLHSFTTPIDHSQLYGSIQSNLRLLVACGMPLDNPNVHIYRQSMLPAHSELTVILNNFAYFGELSRMTQFKEKSSLTESDIDEVSNIFQKRYSELASEDEKQITREGLNKITRTDIKNLISIMNDKEKKSASAGLFDYPVLMAADILLYGAKWVPVGEDQRQHLEFTRDLAMRVNNKFGDIFVVPESIQKQQELVDRDGAPRIRSLKDPASKMSKSVDDPSGTIQLTDTPAQATKKIMSATTDSIGSINFDWENQPGISNLLQILALLSEKPQDEVNQQWSGNERYGDLKKAVAEVVSNTLEELQSKLGLVTNEQIESKLIESEQQMTETGNTTLLKLQKAVGLRANN